VRIAERVDVAHGAVHRAGGSVEDLHPLRDVEVAGGAGADVVVAALVEQRRQPADLQLQADHFEQVGIFQQQQKTRLWLDEVRVLIAAPDGVDLHPVAAHFAGQRGQILGGGDDFQLVGGEEIAAGDGDEGAQNDGDAFHEIS
jgi:hypothetical protein